VLVSLLTLSLFLCILREVLSLPVYSELALKSEANKRLLHWAYLGAPPGPAAACVSNVLVGKVCKRATDRQTREGMREKEPNYILR